MSECIRVWGCGRVGLTLQSTHVHAPSTSQSHRTNCMKPEPTQSTGKDTLVMYGILITRKKRTMFIIKKIYLLHLLFQNLKLKKTLKLTILPIKHLYSNYFCKSYLCKVLQIGHLLGSLSVKSVKRSVRRQQDSPPCFEKDSLSRNTFASEQFFRWSSFRETGPDKQVGRDGRTAGKVRFEGNGKREPEGVISERR